MSEALLPKPRGRSWTSRSASLMRWLHIYISMVSFTALMFFAVTGITLNHPTWLGADHQAIREASGELDATLLGDEPQQLEIAETLRSKHNLRGRVVQFEVSDSDCMVVFKRPGYSADVLVDRLNCKYQVTETTTGLVAVLNDLHKGRDSGVGWSLVIDISAVVMILVSLSGFALLLFLKRRRAAGLLTALGGTIVVVLAWVVLVP